VVDGRRSPESFFEIDSILFSPDGAHLAYRARLTEGAGGISVGRCVVADVVKGNTYRSIGPMLCSDDGKTFVYASGELFLTTFVVNGKERRGQDVLLSPLRRSADGRSIEMIVFRNGHYVWRTVPFSE
jgi:hypothetical protein